MCTPMTEFDPLADPVDVIVLGTGLTEAIFSAWVFIMSQLVAPHVQQRCSSSWAPNRSPGRGRRVSGSFKSASDVFIERLLWRAECDA